VAESWFVTGTDTGVGKTLVAAAMLLAAGARGARTIGLKPIASGASATGQGLQNEDACLLRAAMNQELPYEEVNPVVLAPAVAPHIALGAAGLTLTAAGLRARCAPALAHPHDFVVVEGAGGWRVPLNHAETLADFARLLGFPVVLVVGLRLGCINHALLTAEAVRADGLPLAGWVANQVDPRMANLRENLATLDAMLGAPRIGCIPWRADIDARIAAQRLDIALLRRSAAGEPAAPRSISDG
jgi:dethiobiotin synthetase